MKIWMKIDLHYQRRRCCQMILFFGNIRFVWLFVGVPWKGNVKRYSGVIEHVDFQFFRTLHHHFVDTLVTVPSAFKVILQLTRYINYLLTYLEVVELSYCPHRSQHYYTVLFIPSLAFHCTRWRWSFCTFCGRIALLLLSHTLLSFYYQVKLTWFSGRRLTASVSRTSKQLNKIPGGAKNVLNIRMRYAARY